MHPNPTYRHSDPQHTLDFARKRGFGILSINGEFGPIAAHIPFVISADGTYLEAHVMRSNPIARALSTDQPALFAVSGPDGYISPDWYGVDDQVPTWGYVSVHLRGSLERLPQDDLRGVLDRLSDEFEARLAPKPIWKTDKVTPDVLAKMMRMLTPIRLNIASVDSTWKLAQPKSQAARDGAADGMEVSPIGSGQAELAQLMRQWQGDQ